MPNRFNNYKRKTSINYRLVTLQKVSDLDIEKINKLHRVREIYLTLLDISDNKDQIRYISSLITQIEFQLQRLWKFKEDSSYHRFWELPKCDCPKMDNQDVYGTGHRYINPNCIIHGD